MPKEIKSLADKFLSNPKEITVSRPSQTADTITQGLVMVSHKDGKRPGGGQKEKREALRQLIRRDDPRNGLVFCNRKRDVDIVCRSLIKHGFAADRLHGDMDQSSRMETLSKFKSDGFKFMVCSDVAARGLDIPAMSHVFNFDVPTHPEDYVHRIGRTGRAGNKGHAYTIATREDRKYLTAIEQTTGFKIPEITIGDAATTQSEPAVSSVAEDKQEAASEKPKRRSRQRKSATNKSETESVTVVEANAEKKTVAKTDIEDVAVEAPKESAKKSRKPRDPKKSNSSQPVKGLGDHMPAFLIAVPTPKKPTKSEIKSDLNEEAELDEEVKD